MHACIVYVAMLLLTTTTYPLLCLHLVPQRLGVLVVQSVMIPITQIENRKVTSKWTHQLKVPWHWSMMLPASYNCGHDIHI